MKDPRLIMAVEAEPLNQMAEKAQTDWIDMRPPDSTPGYDPFRAAAQFLTDCGIWIGPRRSLEEMEAFRQIIPYVIVRYTPVQYKEIGVRYLYYRRGGDIEEGRLANKLAAGWGGHIDLPDVRFRGNTVDLYETMRECTVREMMEECGMVVNPDTLECWGMIVANDTEVSRVHVGVVLVVDAVGTVVSQEDSQHELKWLTREDISALPLDEQEGFTRTVSQIIVSCS